MFHTHFVPPQLIVGCVALGAMLSVTLGVVLSVVLGVVLSVMLGVALGVAAAASTNW